MRIDYRLAAENYEHMSTSLQEMKISLNCEHFGYSKCADCQKIYTVLLAFLSMIMLSIY
jgi:hypothetical protein